MAATLEHLYHRCFPHASVPDNDDLGSKHQRRSVSCLHAADSALGRCRDGPRRNCVSPRHGFLRPREESWSALSICGCPTSVTGRTPTQATPRSGSCCAACCAAPGWKYLSCQHASTKIKNFHDQARVKTTLKLCSGNECVRGARGASWETGTLCPAYSQASPITRFHKTCMADTFFYGFVFF